MLPVPPVVSDKDSFLAAFAKSQAVNLDWIRCHLFVLLLAFVYWFVWPLRAIKNHVDRSIAPDEAVFASLAEGAVETAIGDPLVYCFDAHFEDLR